MTDINLVVSCEENGILMYENFANKFSSSVFLQILSIKKQGFNILKTVLTEKKDENLSNFTCQKDADSYEDALILAIAYEINLAKIYDEATNLLKDEKLKDLLFRLWATSQNEYKAALKAELIALQNQNNQNQIPNMENLNLQNLLGLENLQEFKEILHKFSQGKASQNDVVNLLNSPNISLFSGIALGSLGGVLLNQFLEEK